jgi:hypothetical protein
METMTFPRVLEPELLDSLPADDPRALRSREDLRRINAIMLQSRIMVRLVKWCCSSRPAPKLLVELGGGDGWFTLALARKLSRIWRRVTVISVDRQKAVSDEALEGIASLGWSFQPITADVFDFLGGPDAFGADIVITNLFLHHFPDAQLARLLSAALPRTAAFAACEPSRAPHGLVASKLLFAIGCNDVSRHDAVASVRAGFRDHEISGLVRDAAGWEIREGAAFPFTHCFAARRMTDSHV